MPAIHLIRHGESAANAGEATSDPAAIPLTPRGRAQAQRLAEALAIDCPRIVTSTYDRAVDTAEPFRARLGIGSETHPSLHEFTTLDPDLVAGTTNLQRKPLVDEYWAAADPARRAGPRAETFLEFAGRVDSFIDAIPGLPDGTAVFGHGMWFALLIWRTMGFPVADTQAMRAFRAFQIGLPMPNCAVYTLHEAAPGIRAVRFDPAIGARLLSLEEQAYAIQ